MKPSKEARERGSEGESEGGGGGGCGSAERRDPSKD